MASPVRWSSFVLLSAVLTLPVAGQQAPPAGPATPESFGESIDVRVVNVEAVMVDAAGARVRGLTAADFRLLVDGREEPIQYFTEVAEGIAAAAPVQAIAGPEPAAAEVPAPAEGRVGRSILIFLDHTFSVRTQLAQVLSGLKIQLASLGPADRVAVAAYGRGKLSVMCDWTGDPNDVRAALDRASKEPSDGLATVRARQDSGRADDELLEVLEQVSEGTAEGAAPGLELQGAGELGRTLHAAVAALRAFSGAPGRKIALLLSGGWLVELNQAAFMDLADTANRLGYTLYPVDVPGVETSASPTDISTQVAFNPGSPRTGFLYSAREKKVHEGLEALARWTGGKAALNSLRLEALDRLVQDTSSYYWLGFSPTWRGDGRRHSVRLEARRRGLEVRSRRGFLDLSREADSALALEGRVLLGQATASKRLFVELGRPRPAGRDLMEVPLTLGVPTEALSFQAHGDTYRAELPAHVVWYDSAGDGQDLPPLVLQVVVTQPPPPGKLVRFQEKVRVQRGVLKMRIIVRDPVHDQLLWGEAELAVKTER
jgi:VWFA-related protein